MNANHAATISTESPSLDLPATAKKMTRRILFALVLLIPIPFGAVHSQVFIPYSLILTALALALALRAPTPVAALFNGSHGRGTQITCWGLALTIIYCLVQYWALGYSTYIHPVLGTVSVRVDSATFFTAIRELINFFCAFMVTRLYLGQSVRAANALTRVIILAGAVVSFIALSHWFYDNGNLFWIFEPDTVRVISRARWPFVNPNHLGDYMAACSLITLGSVLGLFRRLFDHELTRGRRRNRSLAALVGSEDFHYKVLKPVILSIPLLTMFLALLASQSRGGWFGCAVGLVVYALLSTTKRKTVDSENPQVVSLEQHRRSKRHRHGRSTSALRMDGSWAMLFVENVERFAKPLCILGSSLVVLFFLNSKGRELVAGRLEYGLLYSMDDIRWTYYRDSWNMFLQHPLFGVGLGGWADNYSRFNSPALSGLNPVYLHSDPYQLLLELGIIGVLPIVAIIISTVALGVSALRATSEAKSRLPLISLLSAITAFAVSTLPEFPLRIPAISFSLAVWLALYCARCEQRLDDRGQHAEH